MKRINIPAGADNAKEVYRDYLHKLSQYAGFANSFKTRKVRVTYPFGSASSFMQNQIYSTNNLNFFGILRDIEDTRHGDRYSSYWYARENNTSLGIGLLFHFELPLDKRYTDAILGSDQAVYLSGGNGFRVYCDLLQECGWVPGKDMQYIQQLGIWKVVSQELRDVLKGETFDDVCLKFGIFIPNGIYNTYNNYNGIGTDFHWHYIERVEDIKEWNPNAIKINTESD